MVEVEINERLVRDSETLVYTCQYWAEHLECAFPSLRTDERFGVVQSLLSTLLRTYILYWLEVLSIAKAVSSASNALLVATTFLKVCSSLLAVYNSDCFFLVQRDVILNWQKWRRMCASL